MKPIEKHNKNYIFNKRGEATLIFPYKVCIQTIAFYTIIFIKIFFIFDKECLILLPNLSNTFFNNINITNFLTQPKQGKNKCHE